VKGKLLGCVLIVGIIILIVAVSMGGTYNGLVRKDEDVKKTASQVDNVLQRRADLVPNLVSTVKGIVGHEEKVFTEIANARARIGSAGNTVDKLKANEDLNGAISRLLVIVENYPQLQSNESFRDLMRQIEGSENRISVERKRWIDSVREYNTYARSFPRAIYVRILGFEREKEMFEATDREVPKVEFGD
jgi:LemA protein